MGGVRNGSDWRQEGWSLRKKEVQGQRYRGLGFGAVAIAAGEEELIHDMAESMERTWRPTMEEAGGPRDDSAWSPRLAIAAQTEVGS